MPADYIALATSATTADDDNFNEPPPKRRRRAGPQPLASLLRPKPRQLLLLAPPTICVLLIWIFAWSRGSDKWSGEWNVEDVEVHENPYFHTGDIWKHNTEVDMLLERCEALFPLARVTDSGTEIEMNVDFGDIAKRGDSDHWSRWDALSTEEQQEREEAGCGRNQTTLIILPSLWFAEAYSGSATGEAVYAQSIISTLNVLNYSYQFSSLGWWNHDMKKTIELYDRRPEQVKLIMADPEQVNECWNNGHCLKTATRPEGIPAWKLVSFWYWDDIGNPLGHDWTLSPSPNNDNHFISLSIEPTCRRLPFIPSQDRASPPQIYILAKQVKYLSSTAPDSKFAWTLPYIHKLSRELGVHFVSGMKDDDEETAKAVLKAGITNWGRLGKVEFYEQLARSRVFLGVGKPRISPSPWDALCLGVPFINPILKWDGDDPENRTKWLTQQWWMTNLDPPYVYNVNAHDLPGLKHAVSTAITTPIESFIPEYMKFDFVVRKMGELIEMDWRDKGEVLLAQRVEEGEGALFVV